MAKTVMPSIKSHVKYQDKKAGMFKDVRPMEKEENTEYKSRVVWLLEAN